MNNLLKYKKFINESKMDYTFEDEKKHLIFFSDTIRKGVQKEDNKYHIFAQFYDDVTKFYGLKFINKRRVDAIDKYHDNCRFTQILSTGYKDTDDIGRKKLTNDEINDIFNNSNQYYFYDVVSGRVLNDESPKMEHIEDLSVSTLDGRDWYFIIKKNTNCTLVKTKTRQESGAWAEYQLAFLYGWNESPHKIKTVMKKIDITGRQAIIEINKKIYTIFHSVDTDSFTLEDDEKSFVKYDLIIDNEEKVEVKKYKDTDLWKNNAPVQILLAQQCRMATRKTLINIVKWYRKMHENEQDGFDYMESSRLLDMSDRLIEDEFSSIANPDGSIICDKIRNFYNSKIIKLKNEFNRIDQNKWMKGVFGIYFADHRTNRINDFLIKIIDDGVRNLTYEWDIKNSWLGFKELKLFMTINGDAWEYILTKGNIFVKAYQLKNCRLYNREKLDGIIDTERGRYYYDDIEKLWSELI